MIGVKVGETIALFHKLQHILPRHSFITIYKAFIRPYLDYGDILYGKAFNASFDQKREPLQFNTCLSITGTIRGSSKEKKLALDLRKSDSYSAFLNKNLNFLRSSPNSVVNCHNPGSLNFFT